MSSGSVEPLYFRTDRQTTLDSQIRYVSGAVLPSCFLRRQPVVRSVSTFYSKCCHVRFLEPQRLGSNYLSNTIDTLVTNITSSSSIIFTVTLDRDLTPKGVLLCRLEGLGT